MRCGEKDSRGARVLLRGICRALGRGQGPCLFHHGHRRLEMDSSGLGPVFRGYHVYTEIHEILFLAYHLDLHDHEYCIWNAHRLSQEKGQG